MIKSLLLKFLCISLLVFVTISANAQKRVALLIGNNEYVSSNYPKLKNSGNDARLMKSKLERAGFETTLRLDLNKEEMLAELQTFYGKLKKNDVAVFYYSGHGVRNYLVPSKTSINDDYMSDQCVSISNIKNKMGSSARLSFLLLDCCRSNVGGDKGRIDFVGGLGDSTDGEEAKGLMICYATDFDEKASQGSGDISIFTKSLADHILDKKEFSAILMDVQQEVAVKTSNKQIPAYDGIYSGRFVFNTEKPVETQSIKFEITPSNATIKFGKSEFAAGKSLIFDIGSSYSYTISADGYESVSDKIVVNESTPNKLTYNLKKTQASTGSVVPATKEITIRCRNTRASIYWDNKYLGSTPFTFKTTLGEHSLELRANKYLPYNTKINVTEKTSTYYRELERDIPKPWNFNRDDFDMIDYHFSPRYELGLSYMHRPYDSHFSFGGMIATSTGTYRGWVQETTSVTQLDLTSSTTVTVNGEEVIKVKQHTETDYGFDHDYSAEWDPEGKAKHYETNALFLAMGGYHPCNLAMIELGLGGVFHRDKYHMNETVSKTTVTKTNELTGELVEEPTISYDKIDIGHWYRQNSKFRFATRLGAKLFIPLDGYDENCITIGGGYTFVVGDKHLSSWDACIGYSWFF